MKDSKERMEVMQEAERLSKERGTQSERMKKFNALHAISDAYYETIGRMDSDSAFDIAMEAYKRAILTNGDALKSEVDLAAAFGNHGLLCFEQGFIEGMRLAAIIGNGSGAIGL